MNHIKITLLCIVCFGVGYVVAKYSETDLDENDPPINTSKNLNDNSEFQVQAELETLTTSSVKNEDLAVDKDLIVEELKSRVSQLKEKLNVKEDELILALYENERANKDYDSKNNKTKDLAKDLEISKEEAEAALPKPFSNMLVGATGSRAEDFNKFNKEPVDYDWGYNMEIYINDFIAIHNYSTFINLESVTCKTLTCEIRGFETEDKSWNYILNDMKIQEWWDFTSTSSSSSTSEEFGQYFYVLTSKSS